MRTETRAIYKGRLATRIIAYNLIAVVIPTLLLLLFFLNTYRAGRINMERESSEAFVSQMYMNLLRNMDIMTLSAQTTLADKTLTVMRNRSELSQADLLALKNQTVVTMQSLLSASPSLSSIRYFSAQPDMSEIRPSVYSVERLGEVARRELARRETLWRVGLNDPVALDESKALYAFYYQAAYSLDGAFMGVVEIAMDMPAFFAHMSVAEEGTLSGFITDDGVLHYDYGQAQGWGDLPWSHYAHELSALMRGQELLKMVSLGENKTAYVAMRRVDILGGSFFYLKDIGRQIRQADLVIRFCLISFVGFITLLLFITRAFTKNLLRRMYDLIYGMRRVAQGDLTVRMTTRDSDEIGEMTRHFDHMIDTVDLLMKVGEQRQTVAKDAEIRALQNQINTHFLYNTLETIKMMAEIERQFAIADAVHMLGRLLRYAMHWRSPTVTVQDEIANVTDYLRLLSLRFDYQIDLGVEIDEAVYKQEICKLCLQPIIENAVIHGLKQLGRDAVIRVGSEIHSDKGLFRLWVEDDGVGMSGEDVEHLRRQIRGEEAGSANGTHAIGMQNVQNRIRLYFGETYGIEVDSEANVYTRVIMTFPYQQLFDATGDDKHVAQDSDRGR
ncbi:MAG TPA: sensor histidine kinase [Clostridia bacterium]|nr:sensor histidine kinase [Clostridia bacterium]